MLRHALLPLAATVLLGGCFWSTTKAEGKKLRKDVDALDGRMTAQEGALEQKIKQLEEVLDKGTKLLARNSADIGAEVEAAQRELSTITGVIMEAKRLADDAVKEAATLRASYDDKLKEHEQRIVVLELRMGAGGGPAKSAQQYYDDGKAAFNAGDYPKAQDELRNLVLKHPSDDRAAEAQYLRAETHFRLKDYENAVREFQKVFDKYAKSEWADDGLFRAGESALQLKWCTDAHAYFHLVGKTYPRSSLVKKAKAKVTEISKIKKNKSKCQT